MQKHLLYINLFTLTSALALAACADEEVNAITSEVPEVGEKTPIVLSVGGVDSNQGAVTRAGVSPVITGGSDKTYKPFEKKTKIFMIMKSEYGTEDYLGSRKDKYTVSRGDVGAGETTISFDDLNKKYWDDAHARSSQLSIWAYAAMVPDNWNECKFQVPNPSWNGTDLLSEYVGKSYYTATEAEDKSPYPWKEHKYESDGTGDKGRMGAIYPCIMEWKVTNETNTSWTQTANSIQYQDLIFSNNLANNSTNGGSDNRLKFGTQTSGKFDTGEMKFYHAMSKITIHLIEGDGFDKTSADKYKDFQFATGTNIKFPANAFNTQGTFNIKNGYFEKVDNHNEITSIALTSPKGADPNPYYTLQALAIPNINGINDQTDEYSRFVSGNTSIMMEFTIDNNTYKISSGDLYLALHGKGGATESTTGIIPLEAGKNYIFTFTVGKQKIKNISAQVADWETVEAENVDVTNARINLLMEERGSALAENSVFSIYRKAVVNNGTISDSFGDDQYDWTTGFTGTDDASTTASYVAATTNPDVPAHWATSWYWPNNLTFYHLRSLGKATVSGSSTSMVAFSGSLTKDETNGDYASISSKLVKATDYVDVCWGAPFTDDDKDEEPESFLFEYNKDKGFAVDRTKSDNSKVSQLYHAVGSTKDAIKLIMFHMMSEVKFTVTTTDGSASDHVDFGDGTDGKVTKFELVGFKKDGLIRIGSGLVEATSDPSTSTSPFGVSDVINKTTNYCTLGAVPQDLTGVTLVITTADHNKYEVALKDLVSTVTSTVLKNPYTAASTDKFKIDRWYPGFKYNYTFKLTKKGIDQITATVVNWETVDAPEQEVQIQ